MLESINSSFSKIEHQEITLGDILGDIKIKKIKLQNIILEEQTVRTLEEKDLLYYEDFFNDELDFMDLSA